MATADSLLYNAHVKHNQSKQTQGLDVDLLCVKLEAAKREQDAARLRQQRREAAQRCGGYVPRNAANQMLSTTTARVPGEVTVKRMRSNDQSMRQFSADGKPCVNPKRLYAALNMGMSESEVAALADEFVQISMSEGAHHKVDRNPWRRGAVGKDEAVQSLRPDDQAKYDTIAAEKAVIVEHIEEIKEPKSTRTYKPGDAAKRRSQLRDKKLLPVSHGSITKSQKTYPPTPTPACNNDTPAFRHSLHNEYTVSFDLNCLIEDADGQPLAISQRPKFHPHDRPHWAQTSECGDEFRHLLNLPLVQKKDKAHAMQLEAKKVMEGATITSQRPQQQQRQKSLGDLPENLVSEAVARIKKQERARVRKSIVGFLKKG